MKKIAIFALGLMFYLIFPITAAFSQGFPPPPCCPKDTNTNSIGTGFVLPPLQATVVTSDQILLDQGLTRDQFLNNLSSVFYPDKQVDLILLSRTSTGTSTVSDSIAVIGAESTTYYRAPRSSITTEYLNSLTEFGITDGSTWVKIEFQEQQ